MSAIRLPEMIQRLRQNLHAQQAAGTTDAQLLERFLASGEESAFELLLYRHGPMVLDVSRRVLRDPHDAEDAFQATFLAFVRKCRSIRQCESIAGWLYRVAYRAAIKARERASRRRQQPLGPVEPQAAPTVAPEEWREAGAIIDQEIHRLPDVYRLPFVLCNLEGRTNEEAARELGCPHGTVLSRLSRAREQLRRRLTRRGVTLGVAAALVTCTKPLSAAVPARLVYPTLQAALASAAGTSAAGVVSPTVAALTQGVLQTMILEKIKTSALAGLLVAFLGVGFTWTGMSLRADSPKKPAAPASAGDVTKPATEAVHEEALRRLDKEWNLQSHLVRSKTVRKQLDLSDEQAKKLEQALGDIQKKLFDADFLEKIKVLQQNMNDQAIQGLLEKQTKEGDALANKKLRESLKPAQVRRLREIDMQWRGPEAYLEPLVSATLKLSDEQKKKCKEIVTETQADLEKELAKALNGGVNPPPAFNPANQPMPLIVPAVPIPNNLHELQNKAMVKVHGQAAEKFVAVLKDDQKKLWNAMKGKTVPVEMDHQFIEINEIGPNVIPFQAVPAGPGNAVFIPLPGVPGKPGVIQVVPMQGIVVPPMEIRKQ